MKIAYVVNQFPSVSETFVLNQISGLVERGAEVDIYADSPAKGGVVHEAIDRFHLSERTFHRAPSGQPLSRRLPWLIRNGYHLPYLMTKVSAGAPRISLPIAIKVLASEPKFLTRQKSYDAIHAHFGPNGLIALALRKLGVISGPIVTTFHGVDITQFIEKHGNSIYNELFKHGEWFLPISERWKQRLIELGCDPHRISVHHMGIDCRQFSFKPPSPKDGKVRIITVARLIEKKGVQFGIRAVAQLLAVGKDIEYLIVGDGPLRGELERLIRDLDVDSRVRLVGWKTDVEVANLLDQSDILLAPSVTSRHGDQEGIPVALMEAMAKGITVVSTFHSGIPELVESGQSGFLVPEGDVGSLAKQLSLLIENPSLGIEAAYNGRKRVETEFNIEKLNSNLFKLFNDISDDL